MAQARYLTAPSATKRTGFIDVEIPKSVTFEPGDAFGVVRPSRAWVTGVVLGLCFVRSVIHVSSVRASAFGPHVPPGVL